MSALHDHWDLYEPTDEYPVPDYSHSLVRRVYADLVEHPRSTAREVSNRLGVEGMNVCKTLAALKSRGRIGWQGARNSLTNPPRWSIR